MWNRQKKKKKIRASFTFVCWLEKEKILLLLTSKGAGLTAMKSDLFIQSNAGSNGTLFLQHAQPCIYFQFHQ